MVPPPSRISAPASAIMYAMSDDGLGALHDPTRTWFAATFGEPTQAQQMGWPAIAGGESCLLLAPTGSGKTLAAFLVAIDRLLFEPPPHPDHRCRVVYVSPLKALAVDVERNLRRPWPAWPAPPRPWEWRTTRRRSLYAPATRPPATELASDRTRPISSSPRPSRSSSCSPPPPARPCAAWSG